MGRKGRGEDDFTLKIGLKNSLTGSHGQASTIVHPPTIPYKTTGFFNRVKIWPLCQTQNYVLLLIRYIH